MKKNKSIIFAFFLLYPSIILATNIKKTEVPSAVFQGLKKDHPEANNIRVTKQTHFGMTLYEIKFELRGQRHETLFDSNGKPFGHEEELTQLPKVIHYSLKRQLGNFKIVEAVSLRHPDGRIEYEIDLLLKNQLWEIVTSENGKILIKEMI